MKEFVGIVLVTIMLSLQTSLGLRVIIEREECFSHDVMHEGDTVHVSFVVVRAEGAWHFSEEVVDLVVKGPARNQIQDIRGKASGKFEFVAHQKGIYRFCLISHSPYQEMIDFDIHVTHFSHSEEHAKDEHLNPLIEQIEKLEEALYNIQFEQHWLEAETERQAIMNEEMSSRAVYKAIGESAALVAVSTLQVYLLKRLFERKIGLFRV